MQRKILDILDLPEIKELMDSLNKLNIVGASMNQLGRSVYAICRKKEEKDVLSVLESYRPEIKIFNTAIHVKSSLILKDK